MSLNYILCSLFQSKIHFRYHLMRDYNLKSEFCLKTFYFCLLTRFEVSGIFQHFPIGVSQAILFQPSRLPSCSNNFQRRPPICSCTRLPPGHFHWDIRLFIVFSVLSSGIIQHGQSLKSVVYWTNRNVR